MGLEEDWVLEDIDCIVFPIPVVVRGRLWTDEETDVYEEGAHPYDGVWMYDAMSTVMSEFPVRHKMKNTGTIYLPTYLNPRLVEQDRMGAPSPPFPFGALVLHLPSRLCFVCG